MNPIRTCFLPFMIVIAAAAGTGLFAEPSAAERYRQAFDLLADLPVQPEELRDNPDAVTLAAVEQGLDLIRTASQMPSVDWGRNWEESGLNTSDILDSAQKLRKSVRLGRAYHEHQIGNENFDRLAEDMDALMKLSRRFSQDGVLMNYLTSVACESILIDLLATHANRLPPEILRNLQQVRANLGPAPTLADALAGEEKAIRGHLWNILAGTDEASREEANAKNDDLSALRISSIVTLGGEILSIGFEGKNGETFNLRPGEQRNGLLLESVDVVAGQAVVRKGDAVAVVTLAGRTVRPFDIEAGWGRIARTLDEGVFGISEDAILQEAENDIHRAFDIVLGYVSATFVELQALANTPYNDFPDEPPVGSNAYSTHMLSVSTNVMHAQYRLQALQELLNASLAWHADPEKALPISELTGKPIQIRQDGEKTVFESPYHVRDQPLSVEVPKR